MSLIYSMEIITRLLKKFNNQERERKNAKKWESYNNSFFKIENIWNANQKVKKKLDLSMRNK